MHKGSSREKEVTNEQKGVRKILLGLTLENSCFLVNILLAIQTSSDTEQERRAPG